MIFTLLFSFQFRIGVSWPDRNQEQPVVGTFLPLCRFCVSAVDNLAKVGKCEHWYIHNTTKSSSHRERESSWTAAAAKASC